MVKRASVNRTSRYFRSGFTLLELILSLGLTAVLMAAVALALKLNLTTLDERRSVVEDAQLAKAVLHLVAKDLRATVQFGNTSDIQEGIDGVSDAAGGNVPGGDTGGAAGGGAGGDTGGDAGGTGGTGDAGDLGGGASLDDLTGEAGLTENNTDIANSTTVPPEIGLYGNQFELQIDVSRPLRIDEYQSFADPSDPYALIDRPSDIKTVAYYIQGDRRSGLGTGNLDTDDLQLGLVRRSLDRATTMYAVENGNTESLLDLGEVIAPEVEGITFAYFDGLEFRTEWDSSVEGTLPMAIEIRIAVRPTQAIRNVTAQVNPADPQVGLQEYRMLVRLPVAKQAGQLSDEDAALQDLGL